MRILRILQRQHGWARVREALGMSLGWWQRLGIVNWGLWGAIFVRHGRARVREALGMSMGWWQWLGIVNRGLDNWGL